MKPFKLISSRASLHPQIMKILVISDDYPHPDLIYGDMFVHTRVKQYLKMGEVLVVGTRATLMEVKEYEYEGVSVIITPSVEAMQKKVSDFNAEIVMAHFIQRNYMPFLRELKKPLIVFLHGFEATSWRRRRMNYLGLGALPYWWKYYRENRKQLYALRNFISIANLRTNIQFVFVSNWLRKAVEQDVKMEVKMATVIANGIDTERFGFVRKDEQLRKNILVLRSFKGHNYANDISIDAILLLSKKDFFNELSFSIYGEGYLFKQLTDKVKHFSNITLHNYFIENKDIPKLHAKHGVFLCPSRLDTQGVSMCEAMASGLVPITCAIGGIPEYTTNNYSSFQVNTAKEVAESITYLYHHPDTFLAMSENAHQEINDKCNLTDTVSREISLAKLLVSKVPEQRQVRQCTQCILDTEDDPSLNFDESGVCSYCLQYRLLEDEHVKNGVEAEAFISSTVERIKREGEGKKYDCILGLSGGVDSSYLALKAKQLGLRPLAVHFDNGWNSELAVKNIEQIINKLNIDLFTLVVKWEEFRDLQVAFIKASVVDIEMVTDHAILATLYKLAIKHNIKYILSGTNYETEAILPQHWIHPKRDYVHIRALQKIFNNKTFETYPLYTLGLRTRSMIKGITSVSLLNYMNYNKENAKRELTAELGWRDYGGKHYESIFTRFYQGYILPFKFHIDKRKAHLSNLICSGQLTRADALLEFSKPIYDEKLLRTDKEFVVKKLGLTKHQFDDLMNAPPKMHEFYPVEWEIYDRMPLLRIFKPGWQFIKRQLIRRHGDNR